MHTINYDGMEIFIIGHRGGGASDAKFNIDRDNAAGVTRPVEGTLRSQRTALKHGAHGFEMDGIETDCGNIVGTHADAVRQHILVSFEPPADYIGRMTVKEIKNIPVGPAGLGRISTLEETLMMVMNEFPGRKINIELKGKQKNFDDDSRTSPSLAEKVLGIVKKTGFPLRDIVFSSFSHTYLQELAALEPKAKIGMLYDLPVEGYDGDVGMKMFKDRPDVYEPFTVPALELTKQRLPTLSSVHPEIQSLTPETVKWTADNNLALVTWGWRERSPLEETPGGEHFATATRDAIKMAKEAGIRQMWIITDHIRDMKTFVHDHISAARPNLEAYGAPAGPSA